jgi:signal transduction histidine kinase
MALVWSGWLLLDQQRALDARLAQEQSDAAADAIAAGIRERLTALGERLGDRLGAIPAPSPSLPFAGAVTLRYRPPDFDLDPARRLPFLPILPDPPRASPLFAEGEAAEFSVNGLPRALESYRRLIEHADPSVRGGALLRFARTLRKAGRAREAITAYARLADVGDLPTDTSGVPASLVALDGQRLAYRQLRDGPNEKRVADAIQQRLDRGEWRLSRGTAEFYREQVSNLARPDGWQLAAAISETWPAGNVVQPGRGHRVIGTRGSASVIVMWRTTESEMAMAAVSLEKLIASLGGSQTDWQLFDTDGQLISGSRGTSPATAATRIIGAGGPAWTLRAWPAGTPVSASRRRPVLAAALAVMLAFVWGATYLMARAIRREAAAARLQSDFVAAVSHEFRSPLTTLRQISDMLDADRVPSEPRRRQYYGILVSETARLQRLVESLLNFGRFETGGQPYRFVSLDAVALVKSVIEELQGQPGHADRRIVVTAASPSLQLRGDEEAVRLAVRNLIDNAIKYSPVESEVRVTASSEGANVSIGVTDSGPGVAPDEQATIFRKFTRGRAAVEGRVPGTGVGLAMVRRIAAAHGGEIRLASEPGHGSTFTLVLPAVRHETLTVPNSTPARQGNSQV